MNYSVDWTPEADARLAEVWLNHPAARQAITEAQDRIDRLLAADPLRHAQSQVEGLYTLDEPPLRAQYEISEDERHATVVSVRWNP